MWRPSAASKRLSPSHKSVEQNDITPLQRTISARSTLTEALRTNPFRTVRDVSQMSLPLPKDPVESLNDDLRIFANIYPDVKIEVLRELLTRFDGDSRLHVCTEELYRHKNEWAKGRLLNPARDLDEEISVEEQFRGEAYIAACRRTLSAEFKSLNKSIIEAVLAEVNYSYKSARPVLQEVAAKSWRATITSLFKKKKAVEEPPSFLYIKGKTDRILCSTGNFELDRELEDKFLTPVRRAQAAAQNAVDHDLATKLNQRQAEEANSLFECQCCYNDVTFEDVTTCTVNTHIICKDCVRRSLSEALFGQGWAKSIDISRGTIRCVAPSGSEECSGHVPASLLENAILTTKAGAETWTKFEQRLATDNLANSNLPLAHCPFCSYAESPRLLALDNASSIPWQFRFRQVNICPSTIIFFILLEFILPAFALLVLLLTFISPSIPYDYFHTSLIRLFAQSQTKIFVCKNQACERRSCRTCHKQWHDPHTCHEPLILSLRTTVEAARTAALKRTCPRCGTSFVKSSGCNKLTCICGYAMCYVCRKNIGRVAATALNPPQRAPPRADNLANPEAEVEAEAARARNEEALALAAAGEGYRHFCEHFRPVQGMKCTECNKCDLYKTEDEDIVVRQAGEDAEREWREQHADELLGHSSNNINGSSSAKSEKGKDIVSNGTSENASSLSLRDVNLKQLADAVEGYNGHGGRKSNGDLDIFLRMWSAVKRGRWTVQGVVDFVVERVIVVDGRDVDA